MDDDPSIVKVVKLYLGKNGYETEEAADGETALALLRTGRFDLAVLDLMLPKLDGWAVCRKLRESGDDTALLMLTARGEVHERVEGLRMGADDYLVKPFEPSELLARIATVLRRTERRPSAGAGGAESAGVAKAGGVSQGGAMAGASGGRELRAGELTLRLDAYEAFVGTREARLTRREFELLAYLAARPGKAFSREDLIAQVWGWDFDGEDRVVDLYVQRIRRKLGAGKGWSLATVWGVGYRFEAEGGR